MPASKTHSLRKEGFYFASTVGLPPRADCAASTVRLERRGFQLSAVTKTQRDDLILSGRPVGSYKVADLMVHGECPAPPPSPRSQKTIRQHLECLAMPSLHSSAGEEFQTSVGLNNFDALSFRLSKLDETNPAIVDALLRLKLTDARAKIAALKTCSIRPADQETVFSELTALRFAYMLRMAAMAAGAHLRRPTGFAAVDDLGDGFSPRYGTLLSEFDRQLNITETILDAYAAGETDLKGLSLGDRRYLDRTDLKQQARTLLIIWRKEHGNKLEQLLAKQMQYIRRYTKRLARGADGARQQLPDNLRIGNDMEVAPLPALYCLTRVVVAILNDVVKGDPPAGGPSVLEQAKGLPAIATWAGQTAKTISVCPLPELHPNHRSTNSDVFAILRFALVEDDYMFPRDASKTVMIGKKPVKLTSQVARIRNGFPPLSFDDLYQFHQNGDGETDVSRQAELSATTFDKLSEPMRRMLTPWLDWAIKDL